MKSFQQPQDVNPPVTPHGGMMAAVKPSHSVSEQLFTCAAEVKSLLFFYSLAFVE